LLDWLLQYLPLEQYVGGKAQAGAAAAAGGHVSRPLEGELGCKASLIPA
jgi:hypothetical protein